MNPWTIHEHSCSPINNLKTNHQPNIMRTLYLNIGQLVGITHGELRKAGHDMAHVEIIHDAWLAEKDGRIEAFGQGTPPEALRQEAKVVDTQGAMVMPRFCDSHTHLVWAGSREQEFEDKLRGLSYAEIAKRGGGILNSADRLHDTSEDDLYRQTLRRAQEIWEKGTGCVEIKSGYGLNTADELKMLRVARRIGEDTPLRVVTTFLGAHAVGRAYAGRQGEYVDLVVNEMLPAVAAEGLADFVDVFCDEGFFTPEETARILEAGEKYGLRGKIHADELAFSGGSRVAISHNALSADHLEALPDEGIALYRDAQTMPTCLPGTSFFLNMRFAPARHFIDEGLAVALASDYNPGSTPSGDMKFIWSLACTKMRLTPEEAFNAITLNTAAAMGLSRDYGSIEPGKQAALLFLRDVPSLAWLPYQYTTPLCHAQFQ